MLYPLNLKLEGVACAVVGGGEIALQKARALLECGARLRLVSPRLVEGLEQLHRDGAFEWLAREYHEGDLQGARMVVCATNRPEVNREVHRHGRAAGALVNVVDVPELCDFYVPSIVRRGDLMVTVSTGGKCPGLSRRLRLQLEREFGPEYAVYLELLAEAREDLHQRISDPRRRLEIMNQLLDLPCRLEGLAGDGERLLRERVRRGLDELTG
ncbi:MAG: bifunctional precorrin-2 dehydrogenase/sirohydrochlorin ferrochelatase [Armatimonadetes bacterium]|nr:bifunctional precorrin-2 dehydrogenase/sirohydrochlorin ferrochelatase [Armatimonadota bacterium]